MLEIRGFCWSGFSLRLVEPWLELGSLGGEEGQAHVDHVCLDLDKPQIATAGQERQLAISGPINLLLFRELQL